MSYPLTKHCTNCDKDVYDCDECHVLFKSLEDFTKTSHCGYNKDDKDEQDGKDKDNKQDDKVNEENVNTAKAAAAGAAGGLAAGTVGNLYSGGEGLKKTAKFQCQSL